MLELNQTGDRLEGTIQLSDCEKNFHVTWLSSSSQCAFYFSDDENKSCDVHRFLPGIVSCQIDISSFDSYLRKIKPIVERYQSMYYGDVGIIQDIITHFSSIDESDAKIYLEHRSGDRYIRVLVKPNVASRTDDLSKIYYRNGELFRKSLIGKIARVVIEKCDDHYCMKVDLVENWREIIMNETSKITKENVANILSKDISDNCKKGLTENQAAYVFGIKYAPLLNANAAKFTVDEIVDCSSFNNDAVKTAIKNGVSISPFVLWQTTIDDNTNNGFADYYKKFKNLLKWFTVQIKNNGNQNETPHCGVGHKGESIRNYYADWRDYGKFCLDCSIRNDNQGRGSYICCCVENKPTWLNIEPTIKKDYVVEAFRIGISKKCPDNALKKIDKAENATNVQYNVDDLSLFDDGLPNESIKKMFDALMSKINSLEIKNETLNQETENRVIGGENVILYGVPGAGKSWIIKNKYLGGESAIDNEKAERVVFHPDYTYSDFVGQLLPQTGLDGKVSYLFVPGPFTRILKKSIDDPSSKYILVIEEINRGNAPAIFGDLFQLLDRKVNGESEYKITNADIAKYVYGDISKKIAIPSNLSVIATMNTCDQNVFTLDTAFQRRWNMYSIDNEFMEGDTLKDKEILNTGVKWETFWRIINERILECNANMVSSEDKRLGTHFIGDDDLKYAEGDSDQNRKFPEKIFKYLWDDAFKFTRQDIFVEDYKSLEQLIKGFTERGFKIFKEDIANQLSEEISISDDSQSGKDNPQD